jgi:hypothetical protein
MAFEPSEKARIKHFLAYPDWVALAQSIHLGYPSASQPAYLVDDAFHRMSAGGESSVRTDLCELEDIEAQKRDARSRYKARKLGALETNPDEQRMLDRDMTYWSLRLASDLGVVTNPYAASSYMGLTSGAGTTNAVVNG